MATIMPADWLEDDESKFMDLSITKNGNDRVVRLRIRDAAEGGALVTLECESDISDLQSDLHDLAMNIAKLAHGTDEILEEDRGVSFRGVNVKSFTCKDATMAASAHTL